MVVSRFPLTSVLGLAVMLLWLQAQVQNIMFSGLGLPTPTQRENGRVQQLSSWTVAICLTAVAQKIQWFCSFPRGFGGPEGFPHLPLFYFLCKKHLEIFFFLWQLVSWVISHIILSRPKSISPKSKIKLMTWLSLSSWSLFMGSINGCDWFDASERQPSWSLFMFWKDTNIPSTCS
jgi:hypothetical protein